MLPVVQILLFVVLPVVAYRQPLFGLLILILLECTFTVLKPFTCLPSMGGSIVLQDVVITVMAVRVWLSARHRDNFVFTLVAGLLAWQVFSATLALASEQTDVRNWYRCVFRVAMYWCIPLVVRELSPLDRRRLLMGTFVVAVACTAIHLVALRTNDATYLSQFYMNDEYMRFDFNSMEEMYEDLLQRGEVLRLYPPCFVFVSMTCVSCMSLFLCGDRTFRKGLIPLTALCSFAFMMSLGERTNGIAAFLALIVLGGEICTIPSIFHSLGAVLRAVGLFSLPVIVWLAAIGLGLPIFDTWMTRWQETFQTGLGDQSTRWSDSVLAWESILQSPLFGIGKPHVCINDVNATRDTHGFLIQGLLGGLPGMVMLLCWFVVLAKRFATVCAEARQCGEPNRIAMAAGTVAGFGLLTSALHTSPVFLWGYAQIPFGIYCGLLLEPKFSRLPPQATHGSTAAQRPGRIPRRPARREVALDLGRR